MTIGEYWDKFLAESKQNPDEVGFSGELSFAERGVVGNEQLALVLSGKRTVTFTAFDSYAINREPLPVSGEVFIVEDKDGEPRGIVEVTDGSVIPFGEITWELARREGEDESLEEWREKQRDYMEDEAALCGFEFTDSSKVVCEVFRLIYR